MQRLRVSVLNALSIVALTFAPCSRPLEPTASAIAAPSRPRLSDSALHKEVIEPQVPLDRRGLAVARNGRQIIIASHSGYFSFDASGRLQRRIPARGLPGDMVLLGDGRMLSARAGAAGNVALLRADGSEERSIAARGQTAQSLHQDGTGWTTPAGLAFDADAELTFVLDTVQAKGGEPDPAWSRVAVFDFKGKFVRDFALFDSASMPASSEYRTWYDDIEVDPKRQRVFVTARTPHELWSFDYQGHLLTRWPGADGIARLPNGNIAVGAPDRQHVYVYEPSGKVTKTLDVAKPLDLESDSLGNLYAVTADPTTLFVRWSPDLNARKDFRPRFERIAVDFPRSAIHAGAPLLLPVEYESRDGANTGDWQAFVRSGTGSERDWQALPTSFDGSQLRIETPRLRGPYDLLVRHGRGAVDRIARENDLFVEQPVSFVPEGETGSVSILSDNGRHAFVSGEPVTFSVIASGAARDATRRIILRRDGTELATLQAPAGAESAWTIREELTRRLEPGRYVLTSSVRAPGIASYPLTFDIAPREPDSSMQRILYHEFDEHPATGPQPRLGDRGEQAAFIRDYVTALADQGFSRETDRTAVAHAESPAGIWDANLGTDALPPAGYFEAPSGGDWQVQLYLDRSTAHGIHYDTQLLGHCSGVRLDAAWFPRLNASLQRDAQALGRFPAFYGFNYNDEVFFPEAGFTDATAQDRAWLQLTAAQHPDRPRADAYRAGITHMYAEFDRAVLQIRPELARTATPMWQYPAVEGSYAPTVNAHMTEAYSHYLSEGYDWPWYAAHSVDILRRPNQPIMGVFDNGMRTFDGEVYLKNAMQVLARGVQGIGVEHTRPFDDAKAASALRLANELAKRYGPVFAEAEPENDGAILYSYAQDVSEKRDALGTPHWQRVLALHGAGLMAKLPLSIVYEEDIASGWLFSRGKPRVKLLFLVGQSQPLPGAVLAAISAFERAGGQVVLDAGALPIAGARRTDLRLLEPFQAARFGYDTDALFPEVQPSYERIASELHDSFAGERRASVDVNDAWTGVSRFDGGAIRYVMLSSETGPYRWQPGSVWGLGAQYNRSYQPKRVMVSLPHGATVYDAFDAKLADFVSTAEKDTIVADMSTFPGRLYALCPRQLDPPRLSVRAYGTSISYALNVGVPAVVPLRLLLKHGATVVEELFRATRRDGTLEGTFALPPGDGWSLQATELLGGSSTEARAGAGAPLPEPFADPASPVQLERPTLIRRELEAAKTVRLLMPSELASSAPVSRLRSFLAARGVTLRSNAPSEPPESGLSVAFATTGAGFNHLDPLVRAAQQHALFEHPISARFPSPGRALLSIAFAPREYGENCVALIGGDVQALGLAVEQLISLLGDAPRAPQRSAAPPRAPAPAVAGIAGSSDVWRLSDHVGARLDDVVARDGFIAVSARGLMKNLALVRDAGSEAKLLTSIRVGESPATSGLYLSADANYFGLAARTTQRYGEAFFLGQPGRADLQAFAAFGDAPPFHHAFAASPDANLVLAPGANGVVAWKRAATGWQESWAIDYWKEFDSLDWPVSNDAERIPYFQALIPKNSDLALVGFGELTDNGWVQSQASAKASVSAYRLSDGHRLWRFEAPLHDSLIFPQVTVDAGGSFVLLKIQIGSWGQQQHRYFLLHDGALLTSWPSSERSIASELELSGDVFSAYENRMLELRSPTGSVQFGTIWPRQPLSLASDGHGALFLSDDAGDLYRIDRSGTIIWRVALGCNAQITVSGDRVYAAGWDGRLRAYSLDGKALWILNLTPALAVTDSQPSSAQVLLAHRSPTSSQTVPARPNLLRTGAAKLSLGGTPGWKSAGTTQVSAEQLTNGVSDDVISPWLIPSELFSDGIAGRQVWAQIDFAQPTYVHTLTVRENPAFPDSWPTDSLVQIWNERENRWKTVHRGTFLNGSINSYSIDLPHVTKLRYLPWSSYFRNFHTSEIEVR